MSSIEFEILNTCIKTMLLYSVTFGLLLSLFFYDDVHLLQRPKATLDRDSQGMQGDNSTKTKGATKVRTEGGDFRKNPKSHYLA